MVPSSRGLHSLLATLALAMLVLLSSGTAWAQSPTGTITGRITDAQGGTVADVAVTAESPSLQGVARTTSTSNGDYIFKLLPPGRYTLTFTRAGFAPEQRRVLVAGTEALSIDVTVSPAARTESVDVVAESNAFVNTAQAATRLDAELLRALPTARTPLAAASLSPAVHATGPSNAVTIAGAMSFENLFLVNGVQVQDNVRGSFLNLFIEDAIQETTVSSAAISAEYGRFTGGMVNALTRSGGNRFSGSWRTSLTNDDWRTVSPFGEPKADKTVPRHEYTFGGPILRDRLWFFAAGRTADQKLARQTGYTNLAYDYTNKEQRAELKLTQSVAQNHRIEFAYTGVRQTETNNAFPDTASVMDLASLTTRKLPQDLLGLHYTGSLGANFFLEGQYSARSFSFVGDGGRSRDRILGTPIMDQSTGAFFWSPNFCGVCQDERRDNRSLVVKGTYFLSTDRGSHTMTFGYDGFNDKLRADNHQSGSDYHVWATGSVIANGAVYPLIRPGFSTYIIHWPIRESSRGTNFRTHGLFVNDAWNYNRNLSLNLGVRVDKNYGRDSAGNLVAKDALLSPRLSATWDPRGDGRTSVSAGFGRYVSGLNNSIADQGSGAGSPSILAYFYGGPAINTGAGPYKTSDVALQEVFSWYDRVQPEPFFADIPGVVTRIDGSLRSPHSDEVTVGISQQIGTRGALRVDLVNRAYGDFYATRIDRTTGTVFDEFDQAFDKALIQNTDALERTYRAMNVQANYRRWRTQLGAVYTLSKLSGNVNGETSGSGPIASDVLSYPEFQSKTWNSPTGDLSADQRHRANLWAVYDIPGERIGAFSVGVIQQIQSGTPYGAVGAVEVGPYAKDPGYATPPATNTYFFSARDAFRTETMLRTDLSLNYRKTLGSGRAPEVFFQAQVLNLFNQFQVFNVSGGEINTTVLTAVDDPDTYATFDPFTTTPVKGVNWDYGTKFGKPVSKNAYTLPRTFRMSFGLRF